MDGPLACEPSILGSRVVVRTGGSCHASWHGRQGVVVEVEVVNLGKPRAKVLLDDGLDIEFYVSDLGPVGSGW